MPLGRFIGERSPVQLVWCGELGAVPFKRTDKNSLTRLEKAEMDALLAAPDQRSCKEAEIMLYSCSFVIPVPVPLKGQTSGFRISMEMKNAAVCPDFTEREERVDFWMEGMQNKRPEAF